jgi:hypothetical protein
VPHHARQEIAEAAIASSREQYANKYVPPEPKPKQEDAEKEQKPSSAKKASATAKGGAKKSSQRDRMKSKQTKAIHQQAAQWMFDEINRTGSLKQEAAAHYINDNFGGDCIEKTEYGNPSISSKVRNSFKRLHRGSMKWDEDSKAWYKVKT